MTASIDLQQLIADCADASPKEILKQAVAASGAELPKRFSGAEDVVLLEMAWKTCPRRKICRIQPDRYRPGLNQWKINLREHYNISIEVLSPDAQQVQDLVREKGLFSFYKDGHSIKTPTTRFQKRARLLRSLSSL